jgi:phage tail sheath protein FI
MPEYLSPGVYIEEQAGPEPIEGVSTSVTGFVGVTQRGPLDTLGPVLVTSFPEYQRIFGTYFRPDYGTAGFNYLPHAVAGFFNNGGKLLYIKRVASSATSATPPAPATLGALENAAATPALMTRLTSSPGNGVTTLHLASTRGLVNGTTITLTQVKNGVTVSSGAAALDLTAYDSTANTVTLKNPLPAAVPTQTPPLSSYDMQYTTVTLTNGTTAFNPVPNAGNFRLLAADPGAWGNDIQVQITPSSRAQAQVVSVAADMVTMNSGSSFYVGAIVEFDLTTASAAATIKFYAKVLRVIGKTIQLTAALSATNAGAITTNIGAAIPTLVRSCEFDISASYGNTNESFRGLTLDNNTPYFYATAILNGSSLLGPGAAPYLGDVLTTDPTTMPVATDGISASMTPLSGKDGTAPLDTDFAGNDLGPGNRTGITALIDAAEISIIAAPGITYQYVQEALITQCELLKYRFAILDPAQSSSGGAPSMTDIQTQRNQFDTKYAAIYYPRVMVVDPLTDADIPIPPSGHMAGIYAATDDSRGVWKAPANVVIDGIKALETKLSKGDQDILNPEPRNINALRDFTAQGRGLRVYGARCITSDEAWKYINVRRLFIFIEASLDQGTQWAVFEPNDQKLWNRLIQAVSSFLTTVWREGGFMGSKAEEAFFVNCGRDTMSNDDIDNGRLIMLVGVAPVYPAEFVIIRIGIWAGGLSAQELG